MVIVNKYNIEKISEEIYNFLLSRSKAILKRVVNIQDPELNLKEVDIVMNKISFEKKIGGSRFILSGFTEDALLYLPEPIFKEEFIDFLVNTGSAHSSCVLFKDLDEAVDGCLFLMGTANELSMELVVNLVYIFALSLEHKHEDYSLSFLPLPINFEDYD